MKCLITFCLLLLISTWVFSQTKPSPKKPVAAKKQVHKTAKIPQKTATVSVPLSRTAESTTITKTATKITSSGSTTTTSSTSVTTETLSTAPISASINKQTKTATKSANSTDDGWGTASKPAAAEKTTATGSKAITPAASDSLPKGDRNGNAQPSSQTDSPLPVDPKLTELSSGTVGDSTIGTKLGKPANNPNETAKDTNCQDCRKIDQDALLVYNLCPGGPCSGDPNKGLQLHLPRSQKRNWQYFRASDNVWLGVINVNPVSYTLSVATAGFVNEFKVEQSPISVFALNQTTTGSTTGDSAKTLAPNPPGNPSDAQKLTNTIENNIKLLDNLLKELQATRRILSAKPCLSEAELDEALKTVKTAENLLIEQRQLVAQLDSTNDDQTRLQKRATTQIALFDAELNEWVRFRAGTQVRGFIMQARDKDFIQFTIKRRLSSGTEETLPPILIPVYGNFRLNVSSGFLVSGLSDYKYLAIDRNVFEARLPAATTIVTGTGSTTVVNETTIINAPASATATKVPVREEPSFANIGIGALLHAYYTSPWAKGTITPALSIGASVNAGGRYTLMFGASVIWGSSQRLVLTGGYALGPVARLQQPYTDQTRQETATAANGVVTNRTLYTAYENSGSEFSTVTKTEGSWFVGLTFNLSSKRNPIP